MHMTQEWKRYAFSSLVTFLAGFAMAILPMLDALTVDSFGWATFLGLMFSGVRLGFKMVLEAFVAWWLNRK